MPKTEDGEFELLIGNKQLLTVFFVVVVLFGVFFAMGFIVGKNSAAPAETAREPRPVVVDPGPTVPDTGATHVVQAPPPAASAKVPAKEPETTPSEPVKEEPKQKEVVEKADKPEPTKATEKPKAEAAKKSELAPKETKSKDTKDVAKAKSKAEEPRETAGQLSGTYLQISAPNQRQAAEVMAAALRKKGFASVVIEIPGSPVRYGVLVGPIAAGEAGKTKADLEASGFPGNKGFIKKF